MSHSIPWYLKPMLALLVYPATARATALPKSACDMPERDSAGTHAEWVAPGRLRLQGPPRGTVTAIIKGRVNLGPFRYDWTAESVPLTAAEVRVVDVRVPAQAFLHPTASVYLADLLVRVEVTDAKGRAGQETALAPQYVAWPEGPGGPARIWTKASMPPHGVLDPALQRRADFLGPHARLGPPVAHLRPGRHAVEEDVATETTVPRDIPESGVGAAQGGGR